MRFRAGGAAGEPLRGAGQGLVEYALILVLVVIIATVALVFFGPQLAWTLSLIGTQVDKAG
jgi:Flp pilus assembly pilin Flp